MTSDRFHTTITERGGFKACRRRWYFDTVERLVHTERVQWHLIFGECVHSGLESYYRGNRNLTACLRAFRNQWKKENDNLQETYGSWFQYVEQEWLDWKEKGERMLRYYDMYDRQQDFWDEILEINVETRSFVDILAPGRFHQADLPLLSGRLDLVVRKGNGIWIIDHKTATTSADARALDLDDQLTGYCYIYWRTTGILPKGAMYNALIKDPPKPPRVLANGSLSTDKSQRTTYDLYLIAIKENGLDRGDYEEHLEFLQEKGWSQFFVREGMQRNIEELESFEERLFYEYKDMAQALQFPELRYPNMSQMTCPGCAILPLCQAIEEKSDTEWLKEEMYSVQEPRHSIPKAILSPKWKGV